MCVCEREREIIGACIDVCALKKMCIWILYVCMHTNMQLFFPLDHLVFALLSAHLCNIELFRFGAHST